MWSNIVKLPTSSFKQMTAFQGDCSSFNTSYWFTNRLLLQAFRLTRRFPGIFYPTSRFPSIFAHLSSNQRFSRIFRPTRRFCSFPFALSVRVSSALAQFSRFLFISYGHFHFWAGLTSFIASWYCSLGSNVSVEAIFGIRFWFPHQLSRFSQMTDLSNVDDECSPAWRTCYKI